MGNIIDFFEYKRRKQKPVDIVSEQPPAEVMRDILASIRVKKNEV